MFPENYHFGLHPQMIAHRMNGAVLWLSVTKQTQTSLSRIIKDPETILKQHKNVFAGAFCGCKMLTDEANLSVTDVIRLHQIF